MKVLLWVLQVLLAAQFLFHGWIMLMPPPEYIEAMNASMSPAFRIFIGVAESLGAIGLILPGLTRILPRLLPLAGLGLMCVAGGAVVVHLSRGETSSAVITAILFVLLAFVSYMRWKVKPILPRTAARHENTVVA